MLAQVAQVSHTHHLGVLVIDEMQNLVTARRSCSDMLNFLVKMDNIIGVPLKEISRLARKQQSNGNLSATQRHVILELLKLDIEPQLAKECAEKIVNLSEEDTDVPSLVKQAYALALGGAIQENNVKSSTRKPKAKPKYQKNDIRQIVDNAKKNETSAYEGLKLAKIIKNPVEDFILTG